MPTQTTDAAVVPSGGAWYSPWTIHQSIQYRTGMRAKQLNAWCACFWIILVIAFAFAIIIVGVMLSYASDTVYKFPLIPWTNYQSILLRYRPKLLVNTLELDFSRVTSGYPATLYFFSGEDPLLLTNTYRVQYNSSSIPFRDSYSTRSVSVGYNHFLFNRQSSISANVIVNSTNPADTYRILIFHSAQMDAFLEEVQMTPQFVQPIASYNFQVNTPQSFSFISTSADIYYIVFLVTPSTRANLLSTALNYDVAFSSYTPPSTSNVITCEFTNPSFSNICRVPSSYYSILIQSTQPPGSYQGSFDTTTVSFSEYANWGAIIGYFIGVVVFFMLLMTGSFLVLFLLAFMARVKRRRAIATETESQSMPSQATASQTGASNFTSTSSYGLPPSDKVNIVQQPIHPDGTFAEHDMYDYVPHSTMAPTSSSSTTERRDGTFVEIYPDTEQRISTQDVPPVVSYQSTTQNPEFK